MHACDGVVGAAEVAISAVLCRDYGRIVLAGLIMHRTDIADAAAAAAAEMLRCLSVISGPTRPGS